MVTTTSPAVINLVAIEGRLVDYDSPIRSAASVFRVSAGGAVERLPGRADEYNGLLASA